MKGYISRYENSSGLLINPGRSRVSKNTSCRISSEKNEKQLREQKQKGFSSCHSQGLHHTVLRDPFQQRHLKDTVNNEHRKNSQNCQHRSFCHSLVLIEHSPDVGKSILRFFQRIPDLRRGQASSVSSHISGKAAVLVNRLLNFVLADKSFQLPVN